MQQHCAWGIREYHPTLKIIIQAQPPPPLSFLHNSTDVQGLLIGLRRFVSFGLAERPVSTLLYVYLGCHQTRVKCVIVLVANMLLSLSAVKKMLSKSVNPGPLGWLNCTRQDQSIAEKYLNPKQCHGDHVASSPPSLQPCLPVPGLRHHCLLKIWLFHEDPHVINVTVANPLGSASTLLSFIMEDVGELPFLHPFAPPPLQTRGVQSIRTRPVQQHTSELFCSERVRT